MSAPVPFSATLLRASASIFKNVFRCDGRPSWSDNSITRAAYFITWIVSIPEMSLKNQPQLVNINNACRCISSNINARTSSAGDNCWRACCAWKSLGEIRFNKTSM